MERFVFVAAIAIAILFGLGAVFGGPHFHVGVDLGDGGRRHAVMETAPGSLEAQTFAGTKIDLRHLAAAVTVTPEDRSDFVIEINNQAGRLPMPEISTSNGVVIVEGFLAGRISRCEDDGGANVRGYGEMAASDLPQIVIRAPRDLNIERGGAGSTEIGATNTLDADVAGCSTLTAGDVTGALKADLAGSGALRAGAAQSLDASVAGSGEIVTGAIADGADIDIAGSGEVTIASLTGTLNHDGAGSGTLEIQGGSIGQARIDLAGSGGAEITAPVQALTVDIIGSGDVVVHAAVGDISASIAGSGDVEVQSATGAVHREVLGSGEVRIGG
ncbi:MAG: DUF2807 domain-containing protein [Hyphomonadaceae bacterium]